VEDGVIAEVRRPRAEAGADGAARELPWLSAGLVDLQVNGYHGLDVNEDGLVPETVAELRGALRMRGVTTFVPTVVTAPRAKITAALRAIAQARSRWPEVRRAVPFVHLEGPYISAEPGPAGCHDAGLTRAPDLDEVREWVDAADGALGMITLSPHWPEMSRTIRGLRGLGIRAALGHTHAETAQIHAAVEAGAEFSTHLGNGAHAVLPRHPNYIWAQVADQRLRAGLIADGQHLSPDVFASLLRAKGAARAHLVSDIAALAGMPPGRYEAAVGGDVEVTADGRLVSAGTPYLAGATATLDSGVARAAIMADLTLGQALQLATENPGEICEPGGSTGRIVPGAPAELIAFSWQPGDTELRELSVVGNTPQ
jgi:N-acetylglucosamine-6-phosphate deacetylase